MHKCKRPEYANSEGSAINVEYEHPEYGWIPFTAVPDDVEPLGREIYEAAKRGDYGPVGPYVEPEPEPEPVPESVTRAQGKAALVQAGLWADVLAYIDGMSDPTEKAFAEIALNDTLDWHRDSPFLNEAATAIGLSQKQLDELFIAASKIRL